MNISDRVRAVLKVPPPAPVVPASSQMAAAGRVERALGGEWREAHGSRLFVVERRWEAGEKHGVARVGDITARLSSARVDRASVASLGGPAAMMTGPLFPSPPLLFFDLETTGLSGGAGTYAFLVGCGWCDEDGAFRTRQYLLAEHGGERAMLLAFAHDLSLSGALVTFNGKSFDAPLIETRCSYHRLEWAGHERPHLDVLHPARRFWGDGDCSLTGLEAQVLGAPRRDDVPGFEIPERYFQFLRSGDARPLAGVVEHNQRDLLSLAALAARLLELVDAGPAETADAREAFALGGIYARSGALARARAAFDRAASLSGHTSVRALALRSLALLERRERRFEVAAACWRRLLEVRACPPHLAREAAEALAIHAEHRARDLTAARSFALRSLDVSARRGWNDAVRHRLARLDRKLSGEPGQAPLMDLTPQ